MRTLISGYYGFNNAGDELILRSIIGQIRECCPLSEITVLSANPVATEKDHGVKAAGRWDPLAVMRAIAGCDTLVSGGGGLFQDKTGSMSLYYYLFMIGMAALFKKKIFLWSVGANDLMPFNRRIAGMILNRATGITVRDTDTRDLFISWGCGNAKIKVTADPVLLAPLARSVIRKNNPVIGIIVRASHRRATPPELLAILADSLSRHLRATVIFIPFQQEHDARWCRKICRQMQSPARLARWSTVDELIEAIRMTDLIVSQRLHGLILAALNDIPIAGLSNDPKIERFVREMEMKNISSLSLENLYSALMIIRDVWDWRDEYRSTVREKLQLARERSRRTTEYFQQSAAT